MDHLLKEAIENTSQEEISDIHKLIDLLQLKLPNRQPNDFNELPELLYPYWIFVIDQLKVHNEHLFAYLYVDDAFEDIKLYWRGHEEIKRVLENAQTWISHARGTFKEHTALFYSRLAEEEDYLKHYSNSRWSKTKIVRESYKRALFYPNVDMVWLDQCFIKVVETFYDEIFFETQLEFIVQFNQHIGISKGLDTNSMVFKISKNKAEPIFHVYPINENELAQNKKIIEDRFSKVSNYMPLVEDQFSKNALENILEI